MYAACSSCRLVFYRPDDIPQDLEAFCHSCWERINESMEEIEGFSLPSDAKVCNCAQCKDLLLAKSQSERVENILAKLEKRPKTVFEVVCSKPYCALCFNDLRGTDGARSRSDGMPRSKPASEPREKWGQSGSSFDNVARAYEEDR